MGLKKRKKQLEKRIKGLKRQIEKHEGYVEHEKGRLDTTKDYWLKEIGELGEEKGMAEDKLKRLRKK